MCDLSVFGVWAIQQFEQAGRTGNENGNGTGFLYSTGGECGGCESTGGFCTTHD